MKTCIDCKQEKPLTEFAPHSTTKDKISYRSRCRLCYNAFHLVLYHERYNQQHKEQRKERYASDPEWKQQQLDASRAWKEANPRQSKSNELKRAYGITIDDYDRMLAEQNGVCAICGGDRGHRKFFDVDHDKETGIVRGLLCSPCNFGIGKLDHNPIWLRAAATYLEGVK